MKSARLKTMKSLQKAGPLAPLIRRITWTCNTAFYEQDLHLSSGLYCHQTGVPSSRQHLAPAKPPQKGFHRSLVMYCPQLSNR